jgi:1,4-dihydroxy-2-naphthoate octaprenyltransferase
VKQSKPSAWLLAIRPATLTAAVAPVLVGTAVAARHGLARPGPAIAALVGALLIQIGTNLTNDVDDFERGADTPERRGPLRVTQAGLLPAAHVRRAAWLAFAAAAGVGLYLIAVAGWPILVLGIAAIGSGLAYSGGPLPLGYRGLGDLFVFAFFGIAAVVGTYYVQAGIVSYLTWVAALPVGALATAILVINNLRDRETDQAGGKRTLVVLLGARVGRAEFTALIALAYLTPAALWLADRCTAWALLPWLTLPWAVTVVGTVATCREACREAERLNAALRSMARLHGVFAALFALGLLA